MDSIMLEDGVGGTVDEADVVNLERSKAFIVKNLKLLKRHEIKPVAFLPPACFVRFHT